MNVYTSWSYRHQDYPALKKKIMYILTAVSMDIAGRKISGNFAIPPAGLALTGERDKVQASRHRHKRVARAILIFWTTENDWAKANTELKLSTLPIT